MNKSMMKGLLKTVVVVAVTVAAINRVQPLKKIVYGS